MAILRTRTRRALSSNEGGKYVGPVLFSGRLSREVLFYYTQNRGFNDRKAFDLDLKVNLH